jgi:hypothetical protein
MKNNLLQKAICLLFIAIFLFPTLPISANEQVKDLEYFKKEALEDFKADEIKKCINNANQSSFSIVKKNEEICGNEFDTKYAEKVLGADNIFYKELQDNILSSAEKRLRKYEINDQLKKKIEQYNDKDTMLFNTSSDVLAGIFQQCEKLNIDQELEFLSKLKVEAARKEDKTFHNTLADSYVMRIRDKCIKEEVSRLLQIKNTKEDNQKINEFNKTVAPLYKDYQYNDNFKKFMGSRKSVQGIYVIFQQLNVEMWRNVPSLTSNQMSKFYKERGWSTENNNYIEIPFLDYIIAITIALTILAAVLSLMIISLVAVFGFINNKFDAWTVIKDFTRKYLVKFICIPVLPFGIAVYFNGLNQLINWIIEKTIQARYTDAFTSANFATKLTGEVLDKQILLHLTFANPGDLILNDEINNLLSQSASDLGFSIFMIITYSFICLTGVIYIALIMSNLIRHAVTLVGIWLSLFNPQKDVISLLKDFVSLSMVLAIRILTFFFIFVGTYEFSKTNYGFYTIIGSIIIPALYPLLILLLEDQLAKQGLIKKTEHPVKQLGGWIYTQSMGHINPTSKEKAETSNK